MWEDSFGDEPALTCPADIGECAVADYSHARMVANDKLEGHDQSSGELVRSLLKAKNALLEHGSNLRD